ncbi:hypothetical protein [Gordonia sp. i37]|uniref:hypothetical protein n=1 Tax=Gordonia sp. i37 TaxID=1961707 RepID=UPI0009AE2A50|nr:hypothetical protein [Gordonia sp. i37]OPX16612.1 hypothetical protein B1964_03860 [Gordonia sp. i37]
MTEYFVQPGTRVPLGGESTSPPDTSVPRGNPELGDGGVVQVIDAEWKRRAGVARNLAAELAGAQSILDNVAPQNHYGLRPKEGIDFYDRVKKFAADLAADIERNRAALDNLALKCDQASTELQETDNENSFPFNA